MTTDASREPEGEVTRVEAVRYLQGASGHAVGSLVCLLLGGFLWTTEYRPSAWVLFIGASLLSANGISIWAWDRLQQYFVAGTDDTEPTRTLQIQPFSSESVAEIKAVTVMSLTFVGILSLVRLGLQYLDARTVGFLCVFALAAGNVLALLWAYRSGDA